jgi:hypothetical protein
VRRLALALALLALLATACVPVANLGRDLIDTGDGATLVYIERGLRFDPDATGDARTALGVVLVATGEALTLLSAPDGATCTVQSADTILDCRLGDVTEPVTVHLTGRGVLASVTYRRADSTMPRIVFAR